MDLPEMDYLSATPSYVARENFIRYNLVAEEREVLRMTLKGQFDSYLTKFDKDYERFISDYDEHNHEEIPLLVSFA